MKSAASIAGELGVAVPDGAFRELDVGAPEWAGDALASSWETVMGQSDALAFARDHVKPALKAAAGELAELVRDKGSTLGAVVGPVVAAAAPLLGAVGAIAYFASAVAKGAKAIEAQRDIMREGKRVAIVGQAIAFKAGNLHAFAGPWDGRDCDSWRTPFRCRSYTFWLPPPSYSPMIEITPALWPSWTPYVSPAPHKAPDSYSKPTELNDLLVAAQAELLTDPWVIARTKLSTLERMASKAKTARDGAEIRFSNGNRRKLAPGESELWRRSIGNVAAARAAMLREQPEAIARAITVTGKRRPDGSPAPAEIEKGVSSDVLEAASPYLGNVGFTLSSKYIGDELAEPWSRGALVGVGIAAAAAIGYVALRGGRR